MADDNKEAVPISRKKRADLPPLDQRFIERWKASLSNAITKQQLARLLGKASCFGDASENFRMTIADIVLPVEYHVGQVVYHHGEEGDWMAIVLAGRISRRLGHNLASGVAGFDVGDVGPGGIIGDLGLFGICRKRQFTVVALETTQLLVISRASFDNAVFTCGCPPSLRILANEVEVRDWAEAMNDKESFLHLKCFNKLEADFVMAIHDNSEPRICYPGQVLIKEAAHGNEMFFLRVGKVKVESRGVFLSELSSGIVLGELAVLGSDKRRTATVICTTLCLIRVIHGDVFHAILESFPESKRVFDHAYITRLVAIEMRNAKVDLQKLDRFYGSATPRTGAQMVELFGNTMSEDQLVHEKARSVSRERKKYMQPQRISRPPSRTGTRKDNDSCYTSRNTTPIPFMSRGGSPLPFMGRSGSPIVSP